MVSRRPGRRNNNESSRRQADAQPVVEMADEGKLEARMAEVEAKLTLSEDLLETLNTTVYRQQQHIERLERDLRAMRDQVEAMSASADPAASRDEIPPHY